MKVFVSMIHVLRNVVFKQLETCDFSHVSFTLTDNYIFNMSDLKTTKTNNKMYYTFKLKNNVTIKTNLYDTSIETNIADDKKVDRNEVTIIADKNADINDIINCYLFALNEVGRNKEMKKCLWRDHIEKAIENEGSKIYPLVTKDCYIEVNDSTICIHAVTP